MRMVKSSPLLLVVAIVSSSCQSIRITDLNSDMFFHSKEECYSGVLRNLDEMKFLIASQDPAKFTIVSKPGVISVTSEGDATYAVRTETSVKFFVRVSGDQHLCKVEVYNMILYRGSQIFPMADMDDYSVSWAINEALLPFFERLDANLKEKENL